MGDSILFEYKARQSPSSGIPKEGLTLIIKKLAGLMALSLRIG